MNIIININSINKNKYLRRYKIDAAGQIVDD
jgi:hypothetical protein